MVFDKLLLLALVIIAPAIHATRANRLRDDCQYNTYMCCWTENDNGVADNTDVCEAAPRRGKRSLRGRGDRDRGDSGMVSHESTYMLGSDDYDGSDDFELDVDDFAGGNEGDVHCHGFVWADGAHYESFILPLYKYVRTFDHREARGYYGR